MKAQVKDIPLGNLEENPSFDEIINRLLLGSKIPEYILDIFYKIANGEIITTDIYTELKRRTVEEQYENSDRRLK